MHCFHLIVRYAVLSNSAALFLECVHYRLNWPEKGVEFGLKKSTGGNFRVITIVVSLCQQIQTVIPTTFKEIGENHGRLHSQLARTGVVSLYLWMQ